MITVQKTKETKTDNRNRMDLQIGEHTYRLTEREGIYLIRQIAELYFGTTKDLEKNISNHPGFEGKDLSRIKPRKEEK